MVKNLPANAGDVGSIPGLGRSPGGGNGNQLLYSCLENPMDSPWGYKESTTTEATEHILYSNDNTNSHLLNIRTHTYSYIWHCVYVIHIHICVSIFQFSSRSRYINISISRYDLPRWLSGKESTCQAADMGWTLG